jgi:hypothetical protein
MKTLTITLSALLLASAALVPNATAQRATAVVEHGRGGMHDNRVRYEIDRLNGDVARLRSDMRYVRNGRLVAEFDRVSRMADSLNRQYRRGYISGWEARRRADEIRARVHRIERQLPARPGHGRGW